MRRLLIPLFLFVPLSASAATDPPIGEWQFDEPSWAAGVLDGSGLARHGTAHGGAVPLDGHGVFANTPGCSDCAYVDVPGDLGIGDAAQLSVTAWVRWTIDPTTGTPRAVMVSEGSTTTPPTSATTANAGQFWLRMGVDAGAPVYQFGVRVGSVNIFTSGMSPPKQGEWTHVAGVFDGGSVKLYVNGELERSTTVSGRVAPMRPEYKLTIGAAAVDEGPGIGRRAFSGEIDEVRVYPTALDPAALRASACAAGPTDALASYCASPTLMCPACLDLTLTAARWYSPVQSQTGDLDACRQVRFQIPGRLPIVTGRATGGRAALAFRRDGATVECVYTGTGPSAYVFSSCSNGLTAGMPAVGDHFTLRIDSGDPTAGTTRIATTILEAGDPPSVSVAGPADGTVLDGSASFYYGATSSPSVVALLDGAPFSGAPVSAEGTHVLTVTAAGCHAPAATETRTFTIDHTPPEVVIDGVADREVHEGPVEVNVTALDLTDVRVMAMLDDHRFEGRARATTVGSHELFVTAFDGAGHRSTVHRTFEIVELREGLDYTGPGRFVPTDTCADAGDASLLTRCNDACYARDRIAQGVTRADCADLCLATERDLSVARCEDAKWLASRCGQIEAEKWARYTNEWTDTRGEGPFTTSSVCASLKARFGTAPDGSATVDLANPSGGTAERRLLPLSTTRGDGTVTSYEPHLVDDHTLHFASKTPGMHHVGGTSSYGAQRRLESIRASSPNSTILGPQLISKARRAAWEANGNQVAGCEEYVYEKFYNFSKYQDAVESLGGDFRAYVDAAYAPVETVILGSGGGDLLGNGQILWPAAMLGSMTQGTTVSLPATSAIGTMGELGWPIRARNGTPAQLQFGKLEDEAPHYKNVFFSMPSTTSGLAASLATLDIKAHILPDDTGCTTLYGSVTVLGLCDRELAARLELGKGIRVERSWDYHRQKSDLLRQVWLDEDLYLADDIKDRFQALLDWRSRVSAEIIALYATAVGEGYVTTPPPDLPWDIYESPTDLAIVSMQSLASVGGTQSALGHPAAAVVPMAHVVQVAGTLSPVAALQQLAPRMTIDTTSSLKTVAPLIAQRYGSASQAGLKAVGGVLQPIPSTLAAFDDSIQGLWHRLNAIDAQLEATLHEADRYCCLSLEDDNPCDWSPREFAQIVQNYYAGEQEAAYSRCTDNTASIDFAELAAGHPLGVKDSSITNTTPAVIHYGGLWNGDAVSAVGLRYAPDPAKPATKVSRAFPQIRTASHPVSSMPGHFTWDATTCVLDAAGHPPKSYHDQPASGLPANPECPGCNVWTRNTDTLDLYFECLDLYKSLIYRAVSNKVGSLVDENGKAKLGASVAESEDMGNSDWALNYGYNFGWTFGNFETYRKDPNAAGATCLLQPEMYGAMHFGARAMGSDLEIFRGSAHARTQQVANDPFLANMPSEVVKDSIDAHVDVSVLKVDVAEPTAEGGQFSVVADDEQRDEKMFPDPPVTVPFALGPIPMSLKAGLTGYVGIRYGAQADVQTAGSCSHQSLSAHFGPFAGIDGFASVGLDIFVAEAGVKITLTIIQIDLPFTESVGLMVDPQDGLSAYFNTNLDLVLSTLGGRFSLFLRILFASWEWDLFTWKGLEQHLSLLHTEMQVPLSPLTDAVNAMAAPDPQMPK